MSNLYSYNEAFSRNLGWLSENDQVIISTKKVAIAGMGGVGGHYAEVLARLGVTKFHLSDFDEFEIQNFNRQNCSGMKNLHQKKANVIKDKILDINPKAEIVLYEDGLTKDNIGSFLEGCDLYLDGLDFFVLDIRCLVFKVAQDKKIPALTIAPVGMGASLIVFDQHSMSFDEHFGIKENDAIENAAIKFLIGLTPSLKQIKYLVDKKKGNFKEKKAPSLPMGPYLCAGVAGTEALKILLQRNKLKTAPWVLHFDAYLQSYHKTYLFWGHRNLLQKIKFIIIKKILRNNSK